VFCGRALIFVFVKSATSKHFHDVAAGTVGTGVALLNFEREFSKQNSGIVAANEARQSVEQRQRDIFESHRHRTFALAFYMTGNELEAEEILSDTFIRAFQAAEEPDRFGVDSALIAELSERFCLSHEQPHAVASGEEHLGDRNVRRTDLETAVQGLPPFERLLFLLRDVEAYSVESIAALVNIPQSQVQRALLSARIRLRQLLAAGANPAADSEPEAA
jgi:DNA-directed RNA polymerase specialized sigma24 family protein